MPVGPDDRRPVLRATPVSGPVEERMSRDHDHDPDAPSDADLARFGGVTINCNECGTELFDDIAQCWKCGRPVGLAEDSRGLPTWAIVAAVVLIAALVLAFSLR
ncbi:MAG: hypothetical protein JNM80_10230 [Phycisphaerae bacterium]|nr:hypothetical protein [Phycisphaerae bacterium]